MIKTSKLEEKLNLKENQRQKLVEELIEVEQVKKRNKLFRKKESQLKNANWMLTEKIAVF